MKNKKIMIGLVGILLILLFSNIMVSSNLQDDSPKISQEIASFDNLIPVNFSIDIGDIYIGDNNPNWNYYVDNYDWCTGSNTEENPYIIEGIHVTNENKTAHISIAKAEHFIIRNVTVSNYASPYGHYTFAGIYIGKGEYGLIENCTIINCSIGISLFEAKDEIKITNCNFIGSHDDPDTGLGKAILIDEAKGVNISYNDIYNYYDGIVVRDAEEIFIENNRVETSFGYISDTGIYFYGVNDSTIINNDLYSCNFTGHEYDVIMSSGVGGLKLSDDTLTDCFNITIYGNRFYDLDGNLIIPTDPIPDPIPDSRIMANVIVGIIGAIVITSIIISGIVGSIVIHKRKKRGSEKVITPAE